MLLRICNQLDEYCMFIHYLMIICKIYDVFSDTRQFCDFFVFCF